MASNTPTIIQDGRIQSGILSNILRGIVPVASLFDGLVGYAYQAKTGGTVFTDYSAAANNATANDVVIFDATMQEQDAFYILENFSTSGPFNSVLVNVGTPGDYDAVGVWEYYTTGAAWETISDMVDGTAGFTISGSYYLKWTIPADVQHIAVNGQDKYHIRFRLTAFTSLTTAPLVTQIWLGRYPTNYSNITDGDVTTVAGVGEMVSTSAGGVAGKYIFDLGCVKRVLVGARYSSSASAGVVNHHFLSSIDGITYTNTWTIYESSISSSIERLIESRGHILHCRYIQILCIAGSLGATIISKLSEAYAYELSI